MMHSYNVEPTDQGQAVRLVLILVLMDDALVPNSMARLTEIGRVLILVLMDDALVL